MYALLAFQRPDAANAGRIQIAFEIRSFGCFNGFNTAGAFTPLNNGGSFDCIFSNVNPEVDGTNGAGLTVSVDRDQLVDPSGWTLLGIGYLSYDAGSWVPMGPNFTYSLRSAGLPGSYNGQLSNLLNRNGILRRFIDNWDGGWITTTRVLTPRENILANFLGNFIEQPPMFLRTEETRASRMLNALLYSRQYSYQLFQFVGAERPSGLAISYLQIWRNFAEKNANGFNSDQNLRDFLCTSIYPRWPETVDVLPLLSMLTHNGGDSDIVYFAGNDFCVYAMRHGLFNCAHLYRDSRPMEVEGRYNKGAQSVSISNNLLGFIDRSASLRIQLDSARNSLQTLADHISDVRAVPNLLNMGVVKNIRAGVTNREAAINHATNVFTRVVNTNPSTLLVQLHRDLSVIESTASPSVPAIPSNGAAQGFVQWVAQADAQTIH